MNKIVLNIGLLGFFLSIIVFSQIGLPLVEILLRSALIFTVLTIMLSVLFIILVRFINNISLEKETPEKFERELDLDTEINLGNEENE